MATRDDEVPTPEPRPQTSDEHATEGHTAERHTAEVTAVPVGDGDAEAVTAPTEAGASEPATGTGTGTTGSAQSTVTGAEGVADGGTDESGTGESGTDESGTDESGSDERSSSDDEAGEARTDDDTLVEPVEDRVEPVGDPAADAPDASTSPEPMVEQVPADDQTAADSPQDDVVHGSPQDSSSAESSAHEPSPPGTSTGAAPTTNGWRVLGDSLRPRATRAQLLAGVLCALLGFAVVVQVRQNDESALSGLRQSELVRILDETTERGDQLRQEVSDLRGERDELLSGSDRQQAALDSLRRSAITQGILSGRLPAEGPGVEVVLLDPEGGLQPSTMLNMLEELRNAGAEAIQLNDQRITASSSFTGTRGAVVLDGVPLAPPYTWLAIGDSETLAIALQIPGGAMATVRGAGATGEVTEMELVEVTAVRDLPDPSYATLVPPQGG